MTHYATLYVINRNKVITTKSGKDCEAVQPSGKGNYDLRRRRELRHVSFVSCFQNFQFAPLAFIAIFSFLTAFMNCDPPSNFRNESINQFTPIASRNDSVILKVY